jgi:hypothetical protein
MAEIGQSKAFWECLAPSLTFVLIFCTGFVKLFFFASALNMAQIPVLLKPSLCCNAPVTQKYLRLTQTAFLGLSLFC